MAELMSAKTDVTAPVTWGVVMTVCEPQVLVQTNVLWHLATGAAAVHVYFDDPRDPALPAIRDIPGCRAVVCDRAHWRRRTGGKGRPASQMRRQTINANAAQNKTDVDWLFHIDADEFIWQGGDLAAELAALAGRGTELNLPVLERIFPQDRPQASLFEGAYRAASDLSGPDAEAAFGAFAPFMKQGQYSHGAGKSGVPVRQGLRLGVHNATVPGAERRKRAPKHISTTAQLLHFDGLTPLHWALKFLRYRLNPPEVQQTILQAHRAAQIEWMMERSDTLDSLQAAHKTLFALDGARRARLEAHDLLRSVPFDPAAAVQDASLDLSPAAFDADLLARNPWLASVLGTSD